MLRGPPVPITGFAPATSGVALDNPKVSSERQVVDGFIREGAAR